MIQLRILGSPQITGGGQAQDLLAQPKRLALLSYLTCPVPGTVHRRDTLLALLWPELSEERARAALRKTLYHLRRLLDADVVVTSGDDGIAVNPRCVTTDLEAFHSAIDAGDHRAALELYRDDVLAGFFLRDAPEYEAWQEAMRTDARTAAIKAAWCLAEQERDADRSVDAARWGHRALALSGRDESALQRLMVLLDELGDRVGALRVYEAFAGETLREYGVPPSPETTSLVEQIRTRAEPTRVIEPRLPHPRAPASSRPLPRKRVPVRTLLVTSAALGASMWLVAHAAPRPPRRVAVAVYENHTADSLLDVVGKIYADRMARALAWSGSIAVTSPHTSMRLTPGVPSADAPVASASMQGFADATRATAVVWGRMTRSDGQIRFHTRITDVTAGTTFRLPTDSAPLDDPLRAAEPIRHHVVGLLGSEFGFGPQSSPVPPPPSYAAYEAYIAGTERFFRDMAPREALSRFTEAATLDPTFVTPAVYLAMMSAMSGRAERADSLIRALGYPAAAPQWSTWDRLWADAVYHSTHKDHLRTFRALALLHEAVPTDGFVTAQYVRSAYASGHYDRVISVLTETTQERVPYLGYWAYLADALHAAGDFERERAVGESARRVGDPSQLSPKFLARPLAATGEVAALRALLDRAEQQPNPRPRGWLSSWAGTELVLHGHADAAVEFLQCAIRAYDRNARDTTRGRAGRMDLAEALYLSRQYRDARVVYRELLQYADSSGHPPSDAVNLHTRLWTLGRLGALEARLGFSEAAHRFDSLIAATVAAPHHDLGALQRAIIWHHLGDPETSAEYLRDAVAFGYRIPDLHYYERELPPLDRVLPRVPLVASSR